MDDIKSYVIIHYLGYGKGRAPLLLEDVKTDATIAINVRMENFCTEGNLPNARA